MDHNNFTTPERDKCQHLRFEDRCSIKTCRKLKLSLRKTAEVAGCVASTVLNELRRRTRTRNGNREHFPEYSTKRDRLIMKSTSYYLLFKLNLKFVNFSYTFMHIYF